MSLDNKGKENLALAEQCFSEHKSYHIVAGRAYYAAYQLLKNYLLSLDPTITNKVYPHGSIGAEVQKKLYFNMKCRTPEQNYDISKLGKTTQIYHIRQQADYEYTDIEERDAKRCVEFARDVKAIIEKYKDRR